MSNAHGNKIGAVLGKRDGLHLGGHLIRSDLDVGAPVPHVHDHVVLGAHRYHILVHR